MSLMLEKGIPIDLETVQEMAYKRRRHEKKEAKKAKLTKISEYTEEDDSSSCSSPSPKGIDKAKRRFTKLFVPQPKKDKRSRIDLH